MNQLHTMKWNSIIITVTLAWFCHTFQPPHHWTLSPTWVIPEYQYTSIPEQFYKQKHS